jgi:CheY-like chemotaxis protein
MTTPNLTATPFAAVPVRILFADDVRELREIVRLSLSRIGHTVSCAEDGQKALALYEATPEAFDVVITDHQMPLMTGLDFVRALRSRRYSGRIIVLCSELNAPTEKAYQDLKVDRLVYKPILPSTLRQIVAGLFAPAPREAVA